MHATQRKCIYIHKFEMYVIKIFSPYQKLEALQHPLLNSSMGFPATPLSQSTNSRLDTGEGTVNFMRVKVFTVCICG